MVTPGNDVSLLVRGSKEALATIRPRRTGSGLENRLLSAAPERPTAAGSRPRSIDARSGLR